MTEETKLFAEDSMLPPPMSSELLGVIKNIAPVKTRRPVLQWMIFLAVALITGAVFVKIYGFRKNISQVNTIWIVGAAVFWAMGAFGLSKIALVPNKGKVLPPFKQCLYIALGFSALAVVFGFIAPKIFNLPFSDESNLDFAIKYGRLCFSKGLMIALVPTVAGLLLLRKTAPLHSKKLAFCIGAIGGGMAGLALHFQCILNGSLHLSLAHGLVIVVTGVLAVLGSKILVP